MKKLWVLIGVILFVVGCSSDESTTNTVENMYEGQHGIYKIQNASVYKSDKLKEEFRDLKIRLKYTNITEKAIRPNDAVKLDLVLENETEIELNQLEINGSNYIGDDLTEDQQLESNSNLNIKPGATIDIAVSLVVEEDMVDFLYLRDKSTSSTNGEKFEEKLSISE